MNSGVFISSKNQEEIIKGLRQIRSKINGLLASMGAETAISLPFNLREVQNIAIERAMEATGHNKVKAAKLLGINYVTLWRFLNRKRKKTLICSPR